MKQPLAQEGGDLKLNEIYLAIISRYKDYIEEKEEISVAELPRLVTPRGTNVVEIVSEIRDAFDPYVYENNFNRAAKIAYDFVHDKVREINLPLQFWLTPDETIKFMAGDRIDRSILLCSMLISLGNPSSKVLVAIKERRRDAYVYFSFSNKYHIIDIENGISSHASRDEMISSLEINEDGTAYEFNDKSYADIF